MLCHSRASRLGTNCGFAGRINFEPCKRRYSCPLLKSDFTRLLTTKRNSGSIVAYPEFEHAVNIRAHQNAVAYVMPSTFAVRFDVSRFESRQYSAGGYCALPPIRVRHRNSERALPEPGFDKHWFAKASYFRFCSRLVHGSKWFF